MTESYTITARVYQTDGTGNAFFNVVEKTVWTTASGGTWSQVDAAHVLTIGSETCGSLRFVANTGEHFIVTLGVDEKGFWGDIVTDLTNEQTGVIITPQYYDYNHPDRIKQRESNLVDYSITNEEGRKFAYSKLPLLGDNHFIVNIIIGTIG